ncbi:ribonuclease H-like domain-containing protein, partial [Tanacetum coccineum]
MVIIQESMNKTGEQASPSAPPAPKTAKQLAAKRNQEIVKIILLLAIPDEYILKFHNVPDVNLYRKAIKYSTNEVSTASGNIGVSTAGGTSQVSSTSCAHEVAMLTVRVKKFIQRTGRNLDFKEKRLVSLDKSKVECYNCHRKGHFARECRFGRNQGRRSYGDNGNHQVLMTNVVKTVLTKVLNLLKSLQKNFDNEREKHSRARLEIQGYELALESLEARILGHEKNELAWSEKYEFQNYEFKCREIKIDNLKKELEQVVKERDELKLKTEKYEASSKNLSEVLNSQMSARDKTGLGYGARDKTGLGYSTQINELSSNHETDSENSLSVFYVRSSDDENTLENDRFSKKEFHVVPSPITGNFLTPRADISFAGLDEYAIRKKVIESQTTQPNTEFSKTVANNEKSKSFCESVVNKDRVIIEDWTSDDEKDVSTFSPVKTSETQTVKTRVDKISQPSKKTGIGFKKIKACFVCKSTDHLIKDCNFHDKKSQEPKKKNVVNTGQRVDKPVWDHAKRVNHQNFSNNLKYPNLFETFVPSEVLTRTGKVNPVRPNVSIDRPNVSTGRPKVNPVRPVSTARSFVPKIAQTGGAIRPIYPRIDNGNPEIFLQDHAVVDSGCSSHMTGNKASLLEYEDYNGGFMAFRSDPKGGRITSKGKIKMAHLDFDDVYFVNELKFNLFSVSQMYDKKNSVLFTKTECLILSPSFKLLDESQVVLRAPRKDDVYSLDLKNIVPSR